MSVGRYSTFRLDVAAPDNILYGLAELRDAVRLFRSHLSVRRFRIVTVPAFAARQLRTGRICARRCGWDTSRFDESAKRTIRNTTLCD